ncbi:MAG: ribonuclease R [Planctomycetes bacterium]|nr:ribonuclease R [Planctomycetota bacterium]
MPERYVEAIMKFLASRDYQPLKPKQLARQLGVSQDDYGTFREAVKRLRDAGRIVMGSRSALMLPEMGSTVVGTYRTNPKGFGFVVPETPNSHGDLFIPPGADGGAMTGDHVLASVHKAGRRAGQALYRGRIVKILRRGNSRFVGTLARSEGTWFVVPDGSAMVTPIVVRDVGAAGPKPDEKVVVEIVHYPRPGELPAGVIVERLGPAGRGDVETQAIIRAHGLADEFSPEALAEARAAVEEFDNSFADAAAQREDLTDLVVVTIDPPDARDFDDAISLVRGRGGTLTLGVHIADVSYFVAEGSALDAEARSRGTSVYFPRRVVPMLPEILSNGVCSLQEGVERFCKSVFIRYDRSGKVLATRLAETVIRSRKRLTYQQAQAICDGSDGGCEPAVVSLVRDMAALARRIEARRRKAGMLHLDMPAVKLVCDEDGRVIDAVPEDQSYTHTVIEMFMVEANEAVARTLERRGRDFLRRIHPQPDPLAAKDMATFVRACGHRIAPDMTRRDIQALLDAVRGRPEEYAVNLAVLRTFQAAEYSPRRIGHFALASDCYCHFTSPIRRYPDLTVHRLVAEHCRGTLDDRPPEDLAALTQLGADCSAAERRAEAAENECRDVFVLELLATKIGESFDGVITGVTNFGLFVQSRRYLIEGLCRLADLGDDWWEIDARRGEVRGQHTGRKFRIGDMLAVRIAGVDKARRQLNLVPERSLAPAGKGPAAAPGGGKGRGKARSAKARKTAKARKSVKARKTRKTAKARGKGDSGRRRSRDKT